MRAALWFLALFGVAVASALFAGSNRGTVTLFWPPYRIDLSLNLVLALLALGFVTLYAALRGLALLLALPRQARRLRLHQRERAMHGAVLNAVVQLLAGRFLRARNVALEALTQEAALVQNQAHLPHGRQLRALAHLVAAESSQALQDRPMRDEQLRQALEQAPEQGTPAEREQREGIQLRAARWALDNREVDTALQWLASLPQGAARRTLALRARLKATRLAGHTQEALETARLLAKHRAFSASAAQSLLSGLALELIASAHDPEQLQQAWNALEPAERELPELAIAAAQQLARLGGDQNTVRQWLLPAWEQLASAPDTLPEHLSLKLVRALESGLEGLDAPWLARIEAAAQANPRDMRLQYLAGIACLRRQLWGKAEQRLAHCTRQLQDTGLRRSAWQHLAELAEYRGDGTAAAQAWKNAALAHQP